MIYIVMYAKIVHNNFICATFDYKNTAALG